MHKVNVRTHNVIDAGDIAVTDILMNANLAFRADELASAGTFDGKHPPNSLPISNLHVIDRTFHGQVARIHLDTPRVLHLNVFHDFQDFLVALKNPLGSGKTFVISNLEDGLDAGVEDFGPFKCNEFLEFSESIGRM